VTGGIFVETNQTPHQTPFQPSAGALFFMTVYQIPQSLIFPPVEDAEPNGMLGVGGDLRVDRLLLAYASGIFPWYEAGGPILWFSPDPRAVLAPRDVHLPRRLRKTLRGCEWEVRMDTAFGQVIRACAWKKRKAQDGTWITPEMIDAYCELHRLGVAHSVEVWQGHRLVGGLYGVSLGGAFFGESMFSNEPNASKVAFVWLCRQLDAWGFGLLDCQMQTPHLETLGVRELGRSAFLSELRLALNLPTRSGRWSFEADWARPESP
jgi:leucyl/phenylalanyl-tRNA--protein transferase